MMTNPFAKTNPTIKRRTNPEGAYANLDTKDLINEVRTNPHHPDVNRILDEILFRSDKRQKDLENSKQSLESSQNELATLNKHLEHKIDEEIKIRENSHKMYEQQAKMAAMGEMMDAAAHQWKQPLNALSLMSDMLQSDFKDGDVDQAYIDEVTEDIQTQISHMVTTLSEFRNFFRPNKEAKSFGIKRSLQSVLLLVNDEFIKNNINVHIESDNELLIHGIENEFKHLVLNIINNSKDAFNERELKDRNIYINFYKEDNHVNLEIEDDAGGIPESVINDIFKPDITTKADGEGTGIGLYMSMQIAQKLHGTLSVHNTDRGAQFLLEILLHGY
ncbi:HAMP domain-containing histidine kinase [Sulfurimonas sp. MAG313]|nr:HAMP domain-containing sensor histidine kinase [Sulfurimonas sp. MAG313]MDF1880058.1 HAMP domain-containing histidine kinase [Sulfurimonas sp. MAG313]